MDVKAQSHRGVVDGIAIEHVRRSVRIYRHIIDAMSSSSRLLQPQGHCRRPSVDGGALAAAQSANHTDFLLALFHLMPHLVQSFLHHEISVWLLIIKKG